MNKLSVLGTVFTTIVVLVFLTKFVTSPPGMYRRFGEWKAQPEVLVCGDNTDFTNKGIDFWRDRGYLVEGITTSPVCPGQLDGFIVASVGDSLEPNQLGKTEAILDDEGFITKAHIYLRDFEDELTFAHEMGHAFGFEHTPRSGKLMNADPKQQGWKH